MAMRISGLASGFDTESLVKDLTTGYVAKKDQVWKTQKSLEYKQDAWKELNKEMYGFFSDSLSNGRLASKYQDTSTTYSDPNVATISSGGRSISAQNLAVKQLSTPTYLTGDKVQSPSAVGCHGVIKISNGGIDTEINISSDMTMKDVAQRLGSAGIIANFDEGNSRFFLSSIVSGAGSNFEISGNAAVLSSLGLGSTAIKQEGKDAIIELNGATFESATNKFDVNGMSIIAKQIGVTNVKTENQSKTFDTIKDFFDKYNSLITTMNKAYNSTASKGYSPLTEDEKYALSDKQIEQWENKLKEGALSKDNTLNSIINTFKNAMMGYKGEDGISLSTLGITTGSYFEANKENRGTYKIDENKLKSAIEKDPDKVVKFMTGLVSSVYDAINNKMKSTSLNSAYTLYNDKQIKKDIEEQKKKIKNWEIKISALENKYYKQFANMEKALTSLQGNSSSLNSLFGIK